MNQFESVTGGTASHSIWLPNDNTTVTGFNPLMWCMALLLSVLMVGCGGGSGGSGGVGSNVINGVASKGPLNGSTVCAFAITTGGAKGTQIGSCYSNTVTGNYSINLGSYTGPVLLEATGGTYTDEATGASNVALSTTLHGMLPNATSGTTSVAVTPLTELAYRNATSVLTGGLSSSNIQSAINTVQSNFGIPDIVTVMPVEINNVASATTAQQNYTLALATISQYMATSGEKLNSALGTMQTSSSQGSLGALLNQPMTTFVSANPTFSGMALGTLTLTSLAVTPASAVAAVGGTQQFVATGTYSDHSTSSVTTTASWTSGAGATVGLHTGLATGVTGTTTPLITASLGGQSGTAALTVSAATLSSIAVTPASAVIVTGGTQQFVATGTYNDSTTAIVTTTANWTSGTGATVGLHTGLATGVTGATTPAITATVGSVRGAAALTVNTAVPNPTAPTLGEAGRFVLLASQAVTTTPGSVISNGDIGIIDIARTGIAGFTLTGPAGNFTELTNGTSYAPDDANPSPFPYPLKSATLVVGDPWTTTGTMITQVRTDLGIANTFLTHDPNPGAPTQVCPIELGGLVLTRGVYKTAVNVGITTGTLHLDAQGDPNAVFIFSIGGTLTTGASGSIVLDNGAQAKNVYFSTGGITTIAADTTFYGNVFASTQVNVLAGAHVTGRLFAVTDRVTLVSDTVTKAP